MRRLVSVALALICLLLWWWWPTEEARVRARIAGMAAALSARSDETDLERVARVASMASGLAPDVSVDAEGRTLDGRDAVLAASRAVAVSRRAITVSIEDADIVLTADDTRAEARVIARIDNDTGEHGYQELTVSLRKQDGTWVVDRAFTEAPLRRPGRDASP